MAGEEEAATDLRRKLPPEERGERREMKAWACSVVLVLSLSFPSCNCFTCDPVFRPLVFPPSPVFPPEISVLLPG